MDEWEAAGRAQAERIAALFGWTVAGWGYPGEPVHFDDPRVPVPANPRRRHEGRFWLTGDAAQAILRAVDAGALARKAHEEEA